MKRSIIFLCVLLTGAALLFAEADPLTAARFLPAGVSQAASTEWIDAYEREVRRLAGNTPYSTAAFKAAGDLCRSLSFPDDPLLAAAMTVGTLRRSDLRLRSGRPLAEVKVRARVEWTGRLHERKHDAAASLTKDLGIEGGKEQSLPKDKEKKDRTIEEKIKDKKDKKDK